MADITDAVRAGYFQRVFEVIDGLWFMKVEEESDFEHALELDRRVWQVVPKIQARALRKLLGINGNGLEPLREALEAKFAMEEYAADLVIEDGTLTAKVRKCPWHGLMVKSGREALAGRVGQVICGTEYPVWMKEFGVKGEFHLDSLLCSGDDCCALRFSIEEGLTIKD